MRLENVTAEIRPRGKWETIDLGCALVRENFGKVMGAWFMTVVPLWMCIIALSQFWPWPEGRPWLAGLICVWILPLCDRVPLFVLSRRLFGEDSTTGELLRAFPGMLLRRAFRALLFGPFALGRGLAQPVSELEGLRGKKYRERVQLLARNGGDGANQAALVSLVLVMATVLSALVVFLSGVGLFGDPVVIEEFWVEHVLGSEADLMPIPYVWILVGLLLSAITLIEPFYVGAGFAMYINSRTITEGWDIELAFKRMSQRISDQLQSSGKKLLSLLIGLMCLAGTNSRLDASNERLDKVMESEDFRIHSKIVEVPVDEESSMDLDGLDGLLGFFSNLSTLFFWVVVLALVAGVVWLVYSNLHVFQRTGRASQSAPSRVRVVMGMEVAPESLPDDIVSAARAAWDAGESQLALSLLYRGSISRLVHHLSIHIEEADTESDCVRRVQQVADPMVARYFSELTGHWVKLAYGKCQPEVGEFAQLCGSWPFARVDSQKEVSK